MNPLTMAGLGNIRASVEKAAAQLRVSEGCQILGARYHPITRASVEEQDHGESEKEEKVHTKNVWWMIVVGGMVGALLAAGAAVQAEDFPGDGVTGPALRYRTQGDGTVRYKATYDLCLYLEQIVQHFSRYHKYALGADLRDGARRALKLVVRANARRDKAPVLLQLREELEELKVLLRLGQDVKAFANFTSFEHAITL